MRERLRGLQQVAVAHFAERYGLFVIICLGESIVAVGLGASGRHLGAELIATVALALLVTIGLWWTYFDRLAALAEERLRAHIDPVLAAADAYSYLHLAIVAGIIVFAVAARNAVAHDAHALATAERLALCGGVALYLLGHAAFRLRTTGAGGVAKPAAAAASLALFALTGGLVAWATTALLAAVLATLAAVEAAQERVTRRAPVPRRA
jgi:low temperature requirement protein LtrA